MTKNDNHEQRKTADPEASHPQRVCVVGLGYIGLPTAAFIASQGISVIGVDTNKSYIDEINSGIAPFYEPDFEQTLKEVVQQGSLTAQLHTPKADVYILAVPTPLTTERDVDTTYIFSAARNLAPHLEGGELIILESTSPPGTTQRLANFVIDERPDLSLIDGQPNSIYFAHAPERVLPGRIMAEMETNDRVIGGLTTKAGELARNLYVRFSRAAINVTDARTAEMVKLTENTFRDVNIAFANELSLICDKLQIDVWELIRLANHHPRVDILQPGPGVGGHCIAIDPWFIVSAAPEEAQLIRSAREVNDSKPDSVIRKASELVEQIAAPKIACLGITFKPDIDDIRESPALKIATALATQTPQGQILVVDPYVPDLPNALADHSNVSMSELKMALYQADLVLLLVDHALFKTVTPSDLASKKVIDTRGIWTSQSSETMDAKQIDSIQ